MLRLENRASTSKHLATNRADQCLSLLLSLPAFACALLLVLLLLFLLKESSPLFTGTSSAGWLALFQSEGWYPEEGRFGMAPMIWASLAITFGAVVLALPIGLASAIFLQFYAPRSAVSGFRLMLNVLAGIPSVVYGLWGLTVLVPLITDWQPPGASLLAAILVLALMILPTVALTSSAALTAVSKASLAGALALGFTRKSKILYIAIPSASAGIINGTLLATVRALGETMAVLMVAGNVVQNPSGLFLPVRALTANIALEMSYAMGEHRAGLFASGLLLTLIVLLLVVAATLASKSSRGHHHG